MSRFVAEQATLSRSRTKYPFEFEHETTMRSGYFIPIFADSYVAPGSTYNLNIETFLRALPMTRPPAGQLEMVLISAFVPHRIVWNNWKQFWGENDESAWTGSYDLQRPAITSFDKLDVLEGTIYAKTPDALLYTQDGDSIYDYFDDVYKRGESLADYFGDVHFSGDMLSALEVGGTGTDSPWFAHDTLFVRRDLLKVRAYLALWNEFVRDQNLQDPILYSKGGTDTELEDNVYFAPCLPLNKSHDVFTGVLPNPQKGLAVSLPLGDTAPIVVDTSKVGTKPMQTLINGNKAAVSGAVTASSTTGEVGTLLAGNQYAYLTPDVYQADLSQALSASITDFRSAVLIQHYYETLAQFGSKYYEISQAIWGVRPSNAREDLPECTGKLSFDINMNAVTSTAATTDQPLGYQAAKSETYNNSVIVSYSTKEHGTLLICGGIRQKRHIYTNRLSRDWFDLSLFDQVNPMFIGSSDVPVYKGEINGYSGNLGELKKIGFVNAEAFASQTDPQVLGYQEYGYQEKFPVSYASGRLNPATGSQSLSDFTMADFYTTAVGLSPTFVCENPDFVDRAFVAKRTSQFVAQFKVTGSVVRVLPPKRLPGLTRI